VDGGSLTNRLWFRVLAARYGVEGWKLNVGGRVGRLGGGSLQNIIEMVVSVVNSLRNVSRKRWELGERRISGLTRG
jgi:hypothetical protein